MAPRSEASYEGRVDPLIRESVGSLLDLSRCATLPSFSDSNATTGGTLSHTPRKVLPIPMYTKRVQILHYGPINDVDVHFPFHNETPQPVVFVGENGSGKSILLSHIVNALISAKDLVYSDTPEVEIGRVYKLRSGSYIKHSRTYYFARTDFEEGLYVAEMMSNRLKHECPDPPSTSPPDLQSCWAAMKPDSRDHYVSNVHQNESAVRDLYAKRCALYFPPNRFEEPAWLNEENLKSRAEYMGLPQTEGHTSRKLINYAPLNDNKNWLFDVVYDRSVFETRTASVLRWSRKTGQVAKV